MKTTLFVLLTCIINGLIPLSAHNYGLHFHSHTVPGYQRTSLYLNNKNSFDLVDKLTLSFDATIREEPKFGNVFSIRTNDEQYIHIVFSSINENKYCLAAIVNDTIHPFDIPINSGDFSCSLTIDKERHYLQLHYNNKDVKLPFLTNHVRRIYITFGMSQDDRMDVAPINVRDIFIKREQTIIHHWELKQHNGDFCYDLIQQSPALAVHPHWIINDHIEWKEIYTLETTDKIQTAFNPTDNLFYISSPQNIKTFNPETNEVKKVDIRAGYPAMSYSNYLVFDTIQNQLLSYSMENKTVSRFDFSSQKWSLIKENPDEPYFGNHSWITNGTKAYIFGGYGFYHYKNNLYCLDLINDKFEELPYAPAISPRTSVASAIVDNELYLFGGHGNNSGRQELPCQYYYDLHAINLQTMHARKIWEKENVEKPFIPASTMYYDKQEKAFYAVTTEQGGILIRLSAEEPEWKYVSNAIHANLLYKDMVFSFYHAPLFQKMYILLDKRLNDKSLTHHYQFTL